MKIANQKVEGSRSSSEGEGVAGRQSGRGHQVGKGGTRLDTRM